MVNKLKQCATLPGGGCHICAIRRRAADQGILLTFESETGRLFSSLTLKQGAKFVRSLRARVPIHSTVWHPPIGFNLFVLCPGN